MTSYSSSLAEIDSLKPRGIHKGLSRVEAALRLLGNPHQRFPSLHIAGTNGKGSTAAIAAAILGRSGFKTGLTISPHVIDFRERMQINSSFIPKEAVCEIHEQIKKLAGHLQLTYFEWTILMAFCWFAESRVDIAVIETGMGGRWDATNVVMPLVTAITNVSLDHENFLGNRLEDILAEKMQIIKPGVPCWTGVSQKPLRQILEKQARLTKAPLYFIDQFFKQNHDQGFSIFDYRLVCGLAGTHQKKNAALAVALVKTLSEKGYRVLDQAIEEGVAHVKWPGRLETFSTRPIVVLDGAHNQAGVQALADYMAEQKKRTHVVFGTLNDRPFEEMAKTLLPLSLTLTLACFDGGDRSFSLEELKKKAKNLGGNEHPVLDVTKENWKNYFQKIPPDETILVCGSLYLVSQVRSFMETL